MVNAVPPASLRHPVRTHTQMSHKRSASTRARKSVDFRNLHSDYICNGKASGAALQSISGRGSMATPMSMSCPIPSGFSALRCALMAERPASLQPSDPSPHASLEACWASPILRCALTHSPAPPSPSSLSRPTHAPPLRQRSRPEDLGSSAEDLGPQRQPNGLPLKVMVACSLVVVTMALHIGSEQSEDTFP